MEEFVKVVANYGVSIVIVALFLWDWFTNKNERYIRCYQRYIN